MTQKKRTFEENEDSDALVNDSAFEDDEIYQKECGRDALEENYADIETQKPVIGYQDFIYDTIFLNGFHSVDTEIENCFARYFTCETKYSRMDQVKFEEDSL